MLMPTIKALIELGFLNIGARQKSCEDLLGGAGAFDQVTGPRRTKWIALSGAKLSLNLVLRPLVFPSVNGHSIRSWRQDGQAGCISTSSGGAVRPSL
jgi:hypothetical protein